MMKPKNIEKGNNNKNLSKDKTECTYNSTSKYNNIHNQTVLDGNKKELKKAYDYFIGSLDE